MQYTKYEKARIIGARALQLSMGAPPLVKAGRDIINTVKLAEKELEGNKIPFQVVHKKTQ